MNQSQEIDATWASLLSEQVGRNGRLFFRLAYNLLRDASAAEDVCQEAFLAAWNHRGRIRGETSLRSWLARVVINEALRVIRRGRTARRGLPDREPSCSEGQCSVDDAELSAALRAAIGELPAPERFVVVLRMMQGLSGNEVAELLECSASEVSRRLHLGLERLRALLVCLEVDVVRR